MLTNSTGNKEMAENADRKAVGVETKVVRVPVELIPKVKELIAEHKRTMKG